MGSPHPKEDYSAAVLVQLRRQPLRVSRPNGRSAYASVSPGRGPVTDRDGAEDRRQAGLPLCSPPHSPRWWVSFRHSPTPPPSRWSPAIVPPGWSPSPVDALPGVDSLFSDEQRVFTGGHSRCIRCTRGGRTPPAPPTHPPPRRKVDRPSGSAREPSPSTGSESVGRFGRESSPFSHSLNPGPGCQNSVGLR
jgi:hypothetical protein